MDGMSDDFLKCVKSGDLQAAEKHFRDAMNAQLNDELGGLKADIGQAISFDNADMDIPNPMKTISPVKEADLSDVKTKNIGVPGKLFADGTAQEIAQFLKNKSKDLKQATSRVDFFINRAGKNLAPDRKTVMGAVKGILRRMFDGDGK